MITHLQRFIIPYLTPELRFIPDDSLERGSNVTALINKISKGEI